jgi:hypothetical protein
LKFTEKVPDRGIIELKVSGPCWNCCESTVFVDVDFGTFLCSTECQDKKVAEFAEAFNGGKDGSG